MNHVENVPLEQPPGWRDGLEDLLSFCYMSDICDLIHFLTKAGQVGCT